MNKFTSSPIFSFLTENVFPIGLAEVLKSWQHGLDHVRRDVLRLVWEALPEHLQHGLGTSLEMILYGGAHGLGVFIDVISALFDFV